MTEPITRRLREMGGGAGPASRLGEVVRAMNTPGPLSRSARARILAELRRRETGAAPKVRRWLTFATAAAGVLLFAAGAKALVGSIVAGRQAKVSSPPRAAVLPSRPAAKSAAARGDTANEAPLPPAPQQLAPAVKAVAPTRPSGQETPSSVGEESRMLARAIQKLRQEHDPAGALAALDRYRARFPGGLLRDEATLVRLDALTILGDAGAALATLDGCNISGPRAAELWVTRGELRSRGGRCREALADFERALSGGSGGRWEERARRGRATCQRQLEQGAVRE